MSIYGLDVEAVSYRICLLNNYIKIEGEEYCIVPKNLVKAIINFSNSNALNLNRIDQIIDQIFSKMVSKGAVLKDVDIQIENKEYHDEVLLINKKLIDSVFYVKKLGKSLFD